MAYSIKLIFFDMSRTLIQNSGSNSGAEYMGKGEIYKKLYPEFQNGNITLEELLEETFKEWKGLKVEDLKEIYKTYIFNQNARETVQKIQALGIKTALLTNIPIQLSQLFKDDLKFDYISGTLLEVQNGVFTGKVLEFHNNKVDEALKIIQEEGIKASEAIHIGDRIDDADVFKKLQFGITLDGDEAARRAAKFEITDLREVLDIIEACKI